MCTAIRAGYWQLITLYMIHIAIQYVAVCIIKSSLDCNLNCSKHTRETGFWN